MMCTCYAPLHLSCVLFHRRAIIGLVNYCPSLKSVSFRFFSTLPSLKKNRSTQKDSHLRLPVPRRLPRSVGHPDMRCHRGAGRTQISHRTDAPSSADAGGQRQGRHAANATRQSADQGEDFGAAQPSGRGHVRREESGRGAVQ